ncbi:maleylpyruvate isomerase family mycothiol-dependent enzyme [Nocardioides sp. CER19]|uniref:maleylpyruvate isomerase family mycothiol-dependent enzyme n=1 Tax=Nocardioides sp. CER19 TaxID=3038538 RepID=UPI002446C034|nr:maleylpyruvate isomerase family mycothiol-dependent enzyme [Nocardioides sp. CER19]MDH2416346.1 maleylpyruvate isomerase family mycothiol-dependent enzyme [Nocardioides sp. CER19]
MTRLPFDVYLDHIDRESRRFRDVLAGCDPEARVPSCPDWSAADLLWHLTEVQTFWERVVRERPAGPDDDWQEPSRPGTYAELLAAFDDRHGAFVAALQAADPAEAAWTWSTEQTVGFTFRRQAQESLIHRLDAELTAGSVTGLDPVLAADGVDEALDIMFGGTPAWGRFDPLPHHVRVDLTDTDTQVWVQLGTFSGTSPDGTDYAEEPDISVVPDPGDDPDAVVEGLAADVDAWLWRRGDDAGIHVAGDRGIYDRFRACVNQPIT